MSLLLWQLFHQKHVTYRPAACVVDSIQKCYESKEYVIGDLGHHVDQDDIDVSAKDDWSLPAESVCNYSNERTTCGPAEEQEGSDQLTPVLIFAHEIQLKGYSHEVCGFGVFSGRIRKSN